MRKQNYLILFGIYIVMSLSSTSGSKIESSSQFKHVKHYDKHSEKQNKLAVANKVQGQTKLVLSDKVQEEKEATKVSDDVGT